MSSHTRPLPEKLNPLLTQEDELPNYSDLVSKRRLHQSVLRDPSVVLNYVYLGVPIPRVVSGVHKSKRDTHYLMRRSGDGFVSATAMFKATFPWASIPESDVERDYVRRLPGTSDEETAGNVWITPLQALKLAQEYRIKYWIRALLDPARYTGVRTAPDGTTIPAPPKFNLAEYDAAEVKADTPDDSEDASDAETVKPGFAKEKPRLAPPTPPSSFSRTTRSRRSVSPQKAAARRTPAAASAAAATATATPRTRSSRSSARIRAQSKEPQEESSRQQSFRDDASTTEYDADVDAEADVAAAAAHEVVINTIEEEETGGAAADEATIEVVTRTKVEVAVEEEEEEEDVVVVAVEEGGAGDDEVETQTEVTETEIETKTEVVTETVETKVEVAEGAGDDTDESRDEVEAAAEEEEEAAAAAAVQAALAAAESTEDAEPQAVIHVHKEVFVDEATGERIETSRVEVEPALTLMGGPPTAAEVAEMLAEAKAMVRGATRDVEGTPTRSTLDSSSKRKAEDMSMGDDGDEGEGADADEQRAKRTKVQEPAAVEVKKQHIRKRALFGIGMTVAIGALSTWATAIL